MENSDSILISIGMLASRGCKILVLACVCSIALPAWAADDGQPAATPAREVPAVARDASRGPVFNIYEYVVDGNSLLTDLDIENAMAPFMGEGRSLSDVDAARAALEKVYHDAGYLTVVVSIPEQNVDSGAVALHVVEAEIERVRVKGAEYALPSAIKAQVPELAEGHIPNFNKLQKELAAVNRNPNVKVTPVLRAGKLPGTVEVQLDTDDQLPVHGSVEVSNRQTPNTTPERVSTSLRYDNLWQLGHSFGLTLQTAPERTSDVRVAAGTYVWPIGSDGNALSIYAVRSRSRFASLANSPGLGLLGNTDTLGLRYAVPLGSASDYTHTFSFGVDYKNVKQTVLLQEGGSTDTPIIYMPFVANYTASLFGEGRSTTFDVTATSGLRGFFGNKDENFDAKRSGASATFLAVNTNLQHTENFAHWALFGKLNLQLASGPLVPSEQMTVGGAESVRGYLEGERAADDGVRTTIELRTPQFNLGGPNSDWRLSSLLFVDAAWLTMMQPISPQPAHESLRGVGLGFRFSAPHGLTVEVDAARALVDGDTTRAGDKRIHARTVLGF